MELGYLSLVFSVQEAVWEVLRQMVVLEQKISSTFPDPKDRAKSCPRQCQLLLLSVALVCLLPECLLIVVQ